MISHKWLGLALLLLAYAAVSIALDRQRRKHDEAQLRQFGREESLDETAMENLLSVRKDVRSKVRTAVRVGVCWVNVPILPILVAPLAFTQSVLGIKSNLAGALSFFGGFVLAWVWWSVNISLWRRWVARRELDAGELQSQAEEAGLIWPPGHFLERTELDNILDRMR